MWYAQLRNFLVAKSEDSWNSLEWSWRLILGFLKAIGGFFSQSPHACISQGPLFKRNDSYLTSKSSLWPGESDNTARKRFALYAEKIGLMGRGGQKAGIKPHLGNAKSNCDLWYVFPPLNTVTTFYAKYSPNFSALRLSLLRTWSVFIRY